MFLRKHIFNINKSTSKPSTGEPVYDGSKFSNFFLNWHKQNIRIGLRLSNKKNGVYHQHPRPAHSRWKLINKATHSIFKMPFNLIRKIRITKMSITTLIGFAQKLTTGKRDMRWKKDDIWETVDNLWLFHSNNATLVNHRFYFDKNLYQFLFIYFVTFIFADLLTHFPARGEGSVHSNLLAIVHGFSFNTNVNSKFQRSRLSHIFTRAILFFIVCLILDIFDNQREKRNNKN